jgi:hypothetical protein
MNRPSRAYKTALGTVAVLLFVSVFYSQRYLNTQREVLGLTRIAPLENAPPVLEFTTKALGGFRGLIANALWIRATELQDEGKYFEMVQLADWITKLEPHLAQVWANQAWNMAYNISVKFNDSADRWPWVYRGIELLRDEGLKYNPTEPLIYRELGWIFQHKMGAYMDDAHQLYKERWARMMSEVIGDFGPPKWDELLNPTTPEAKERVRKLREVYKMDPQFMKTVDQEYGPLEWRLPETSAIYWAVLGLKNSEKEKLKKEDFVMLRRIIFQSMQLAFMRGRLVAPNKSGNEFLYLPNLEIIKRTSDAYLEQAELEPDKHDNILNAHKNFVSTAIYFLYAYNRREAAQQWFDYWKKQYPEQLLAMNKPNLTLDEYALMRVTEDLETTDPIRARAAIEGQLQSAFLNYAIGEEAPGTNAELWARQLYGYYTEKLGNTGKIQERMGLPPYHEIWKQAVLRMLSPEFPMNPTLKEQLRTYLGARIDFEIPSSTNKTATAEASPRVK